MEDYQFISPSPLLVPYVKQYWFLRCNDLSPAVQRIIPTASVALMFHRGQRMLSLEEGVLQPRSFISGQTSSYFEIKPTGSVDIISVVFRPYGAKAFFDIPISEINDLHVGLDCLSDSSLVELESRLTETSDNEACVGLIEAYLLKRLRLSKEYNYKRMSAVVGAIDKGVSDIGALSQISCLSYKQFQRTFNQYIGANPKDFLRVVRFQRALYVLQCQPDIMLTQLAVECGYYDQSHLIKEFKAFTGYTPGEFLSYCPAYSDYFS